MKESIARAFSYLQSKKIEFGVGREVDSMDFHVEAIDLMHNGAVGDVGVAFFVAAFSALRHTPATAATLILGDMSISGGIKELRSLNEILQLAMDNGVKRALLPIANKRQFMDVNSDVVEHVDPVFYGEPKAAAFKALG
jgi:ATP-dependent Lon protease